MLALLHSLYCSIRQHSAFSRPIDFCLRVQRKVKRVSVAHTSHVEHGKNAVEVGTVNFDIRLTTF